MPYLATAYLADTMARVWDDEMDLRENAEAVAAEIKGDLLDPDIYGGTIEATDDLVDAIIYGVEDSVVPFEFLNFTEAAAHVRRSLVTGGFLDA